MLSRVKRNECQWSMRREEILANLVWEIRVEPFEGWRRSDEKATLPETMLARKGTREYEGRNRSWEKRESPACCYGRGILPFIASRSDRCRADTWKELYSRSPFQSSDGTISSETANDQANIYFCTFFRFPPGLCPQRRRPLFLLAIYGRWVTLCSSIDPSRLPLDRIAISVPE